MDSPDHHMSVMMNTQRGSRTPSLRGRMPVQKNNLRFQTARGMISNIAGRDELRSRVDSRATLQAIAGVRKAHKHTCSARLNGLDQEDSLQHMTTIGRLARPSIAETSQQNNSQRSSVQPRIFFGNRLGETSENSTVFENGRELSHLSSGRLRVISQRREEILPSVQGTKKSRHTYSKSGAEQNLGQDHSLPKLGREAGLSKTAFKRGESSPSLASGKLAYLQQGDQLTPKYRSSNLANMKPSQITEIPDSLSEAETVQRWKSVPPVKPPSPRGEEKVLSLLLNSVNSKRMTELGTVGYLQRLIKQNRARIAELEGTLKKLKVKNADQPAKQPTLSKPPAGKSHWKRTQPVPTPPSSVHSVSEQQPRQKLASMADVSKQTVPVQDIQESWDTLIEKEKRSLVAARDLYLLQEEIVLRLLEENQYLDNIYGDYLDGLVENSYPNATGSPLGDLSPIYAPHNETATGQDREQMDSMQEFAPNTETIPRTRSEKGTNFDKEWVGPLQSSQVGARSTQAQMVSEKIYLPVESRSNSSMSEDQVQQTTSEFRPTQVPELQLDTVMIPTLQLHPPPKQETLEAEKHSKLLRNGSSLEDPNQKPNSSSNFTFLKQESSPQTQDHNAKKNFGGDIQSAFAFPNSRQIQVNNSQRGSSAREVKKHDIESSSSSSGDSLLSGGIQEHPEPRVQHEAIADSGIPTHQSKMKNSVFEEDPGLKPAKVFPVAQSPMIFIPRYEPPVDMSTKFPKLAELFKAIEAKKPGQDLAKSEKPELESSAEPPKKTEDKPEQNLPEVGEPKTDPVAVDKPPVEEPKQGETDPSKQKDHRPMSKATLDILARLYNPNAASVPMGRWGMANSTQRLEPVTGTKPTLTSVMAQVGESTSLQVGPTDRLVTPTGENLIQPKGTFSQLALPKFKDLNGPDDKGKRAFEDLFGKISAKSINEQSEQARSGANTGRNVDRRDVSQRSFVGQGGGTQSPTKAAFMDVLSMFKLNSVKHPSDEQSQPEVKELDRNGQNEIALDRLKSLRVSSNYPMQVKLSAAELFNPTSSKEEIRSQKGIDPEWNLKTVEEWQYSRSKPKIKTQVIPPIDKSPTKSSHPVL